MRNTAVKTGRRMSSFFPKVSSSEEEESEVELEEYLEIPTISSAASKKESGKRIEVPAVTTGGRMKAGARPSKKESDDYLELPAITGRPAGIVRLTISTVSVGE